MTVTNCPFCRIEDRDAVNSNKFTINILDKYPISSGYILIVPRRHVISVFTTTNREQCSAARRSGASEDMDRKEICAKRI